MGLTVGVGDSGRDVEDVAARGGRRNRGRLRHGLANRLGRNRLGCDRFGGSRLAVRQALKLQASMTPLRFLLAWLFRLACLGLRRRLLGDRFPHRFLGRLPSRFLRNLLAGLAALFGCLACLLCDRLAGARLRRSGAGGCLLQFFLLCGFLLGSHQEFLCHFKPDCCERSPRRLARRFRKQRKHRENQRLSLEIVIGGIARRADDLFPYLRQPCKARQVRVGIALI